MNELVWTPSIDRINKSEMKRFIDRFTPDFSYSKLHQKSIDDPQFFWNSLMAFYDFKFTGEMNPAFKSLDFSEYNWYPNLKCNFSENLLKNGKDESIALNFVHESGLSRKLTYKELKKEVLNLQQYLKGFVKTGDVVAAYMPNIPETIVSMLAANSIGATFTSTSSDFGIEGVFDRFSQSNPKVLIAAVGYEYFGKYFDQTDKILELEKRLPHLEKIILVDFLDKGLDLSKFKKAETYSVIQQNKVESKLEFIQLPFSHPLYIMYSSGTTGKPKCIVHSQGGTLLQHIKELGLHSDLTENKKICFFTTCGWMMWNWLVSSLYFGVEIVLYEGSPAHPNPEYFFKIINREKIHIFGTSPKFLKALEDSHPNFSEGFNTLETILSTGSPLLPEQYDFVYKKIKSDVLLASISGGTDIIGCFMLGNPILPVYRGEIQCIGLGMDVGSLDSDGKYKIDCEGELVCKKSFPSRPIYFLDDKNNEKINSAYFNQNPDVWTHGDFIKITKRGGVVVYGRSDATLNPGGVRIGTAEIYRQTESMSFIEDAICVGRAANGDVDVVLFIKLRANEELTIERKKQIKEVIRKNTTPRHVPREIYAIKDIPYTRSGKKVELAVARIISKREVNNLEAVANPDCLEEYKKYI